MKAMVKTPTQRVTRVNTLYSKINFTITEGNVSVQSVSFPTEKQVCD